MTTGNVVTDNGSSWSLLGTLSQAMAGADHYWDRCHRQWQELITTGIVVTDNGRSWSLLGTLSQTMAGADHYWDRCHRQWQELITTGKVVTDNGSSWSLLGSLSQTMAVVDHYWERCHRHLYFLKFILKKYALGSQTELPYSRTGCGFVVVVTDNGSSWRLLGTLSQTSVLSQVHR